MKNVLVLVHEDAGQEARLQAGLDLTRALNGHLRCLDVYEPIMITGVAPTYGMVAAETMLLDEACTSAKENLRSIEQRLTREDVPWSVGTMRGDIAECIADQVDLTDLIVLNRRLDDFTGPDMPGIASKIALKTRKPIMVVPQESRGITVAGKVMIAWDGSGPAMAALEGSVPLLNLAASVTLIEVGSASERSAKDAAAYLSRHDVSVRIKTIAAPGPSRSDVARLIKSNARNSGADYIVMGAYGHSRIGEAMFGGVTREMLATSPVPLLLAH